jgi:hypothetical protein
MHVRPHPGAPTVDAGYERERQEHGADHGQHRVGLAVLVVDDVEGQVDQRLALGHQVVHGLHRGVDVVLGWGGVGGVVEEELVLHSLPVFRWWEHAYAAEW